MENCPKELNDLLKMARLGNGIAETEPDLSFGLRSVKY